MSVRYITLKEGFRLWLQRKGLFDPAVADDKREELRRENDMRGLELDGLRLGVLFEIKDLINMATRFGEVVQQSELNLVVSETPDESTKKILDRGIWPEGPHCSPLALHERVLNHRSSWADRRPDYLKSPLELYHGHFLFFNHDEFLEWLETESGERDTHNSSSARSTKSVLKVRVSLPKDQRKESRQVQKLIEFFKHREVTWPKGKTVPSEEEDGRAVETAFPDWTVSRAALRYARKMGTSHIWTRQGRGRRS